ncbi:MAG: LysR family transcriptional regulator [Gammaproteobacteria bacterium]|nr:LysR family transcriptional regulator [Gammaproteobacteria bacterium]
MAHLNFHHLRYFWIVAKEGHLTRAAERLHVSQSALSSQIRQLESQLGHDLFIREGRRLRLTAVGALTLDYAEAIFSLGNELVGTLGGSQETVQRIRVGAVATLSRNFQENFLRPIIGMQNLQIVLESAGLGELLDRLAVHKLDLVLSNRPVAADAQQALRCRRIAHQKVYLVGPPRRRRKAFRFPRDVADLDLLLPGRSSDIRSQFMSLCDGLSPGPRVHAEVDDMAMLRLMARDSGAVAVVPEVVVQDELRSGVLQKYCEVPKVFENFYAITTQRHLQPAVLKDLLAAS